MFSLAEINQQNLDLIENFLDTKKDIINTLNCCFDEYYRQLEKFKFLPGHRSLILALPAEIKRFREHTMKPNMEHTMLHAQRSNEHDLPDDVPMEETVGKEKYMEKYMKKLIKSLMGAIRKIVSPVGYVLPNDLISEANIHDFICMSSSKYKCRVTCPFCPKSISIIYEKNYWQTSNVTKHLKQHVHEQVGHRVGHERRPGPEGDH